MVALSEKCFLCALDGVSLTRDSGGIFVTMTCRRCGIYRISLITLTAKAEAFKHNGFILSGYVREFFELNHRPLEITESNLGSILTNPSLPDPSSISDKTYKLLERIRAKCHYFGEIIRFNVEDDYSLAYAANVIEFKNLLFLLKEKRLITLEVVTETPNGPLLARITLTADGWELGSRLTTRSITDQCFIAAWADESMNEYILTIKRVVGNAGYKPLFIPEEHYSERIMDKALSEIKKSRFLVVDLTGERNSVFFEAGFAQGQNIEAIYIMKKRDGARQPPEFYVKHYRCYIYDNIEELNEILISAINARFVSAKSPQI